MSSSFDAYPAGVALHVVRHARANAHCFFGEDDRLAFLRWLRKYSVRFECVIHAYVLMGNHAHLLLTATDGDAPARLMTKLCERHTQHLNAIRGCASSLWEEAFEASPIHVKRHFLACMRYIELNPVRARLVARAGAYRWSSYPANALGREDALITPHPFYYALGRNGPERQRAYQRLFTAPVLSRDRTPAGRRTGPRGPSRPT